MCVCVCVCAHACVHLCPTLCDPMDCSLPVSSVLGILQARILEWAAIPFSRRSSWSRDWTQVSCISGRYFTIWAIREAPFFLLISSNKQAFFISHHCLQHFIFLSFGWAGSSFQILEHMGFSSCSAWARWPQGMRDLSTPTRDQTLVCPLCWNADS